MLAIMQLDPTGPSLAATRGALLVLSTLLLVAAWYDWRELRVPNVLVIAGSSIAVALHATLPTGAGLVAATPGGIGFFGALSGLLLGTLLLLPLYALKIMGAGDVKLLAMVGAFLGPADLASAVVASLLAGGLLALVLTIQRRGLAQLVRNLLTGWQRLRREYLTRAGNDYHVPADTVGPMPFAVAIAAGSIASLLLRAQANGLI